MKDKFADKGEKKSRSVMDSDAEKEPLSEQRAVKKPRRGTEYEKITEMADDFPRQAEEVRRSFDAYVEDLFARIGDEVSDCL